MHRLTDVSLRWPRATLLLVLATTIFFAFGLPKVELGLGYHPLLGPEHPAIRELNRFNERFSQGFPIYIGWSCEIEQVCRSVLDEPSREMAASIALELRQLDEILAVRIPADTLPVMPPRGSSAMAEPAVSQPDLDPGLLNHALWAEKLVSADASAGVIAVYLRDATGETAIAAVDQITSLLAPYEVLGFEFDLIGHAVEFAIAGRDLAASSLLLVPVIAAGIGVMIFLLLGSCLVSLASVVTVGVALVWTLGLIGWLGFPLDGVLQGLAPLILVIGVCDSVHLLSRYVESDDRQETPSRSEEVSRALSRASRDVEQPCLFTSLTTAAAFLSFSTSNLPAFTRFGIASGFGIAACLVLTFTFLPVCVRQFSAIRAHPRRTLRRWNAVLASVLRAVEQRPFSLLTLGALSLGISLVGWFALLRIDTDGFEMYGAESQIVRWLTSFENSFEYGDSLEIMIELLPGTSASDEEVISTLARFGAALSEQPFLGGTSSIGDLVRVGMTTQGAARSSYAGASDTYWMDHRDTWDSLRLQHPQIYNNWVSSDGRTLRVSVQAAFLSYEERRIVLAKIREVAAGLWGLSRVSFTGPLAMGVYWIQDLQRTQLQSLVVAFVLALALIALLLRSVLWAFAAMIPALFSVSIILGAMGLSGTQLDVGRTMLGAVILGIAVDNGVHLLSHHRRRFRSGSSIREATHYAVLYSGRPLITTSLALSVGFLALMSSPWQTISSFGILVGLAILVALAADLILLPALLFAFSGREPAQVGPRLEPSARSLQPSRAVALLLVVVPVVTTLGVAGCEAVRTGPAPELACWVLPNGRVAPVSSPSCPLESNSQVRLVREPGHDAQVAQFSRIRQVAAESTSQLELGSEVEGALDWATVAVLNLDLQQRLERFASAALIAVVLLLIPVVVVWGSRSSAALPFGLFSAMTAVVLVCTLCSQSLWLTRICLAASVFAPATLIHMSLSLSDTRGADRSLPGLAGASYLLSILLLPICLVALEREPVVWPIVLWLVGASITGSWLVLIGSCSIEAYRSDSALRRSRARVLLFGSLLLPVVFLIAWLAPARGSFATPYLAVSAIALPLPLGLAISKYSLFGLKHGLRRSISRLLYVASAALAMTSVTVLALADRHVEFLDPTRLFLIFFAFAAAIELAGGYGLVELIVSPESQRLRRVRERFLHRLRELRSQTEVAGYLGDAIKDGLKSHTGCVFLRAGGSWRPAASFGADPPTRLELARKALESLQGQPIVQLRPRLQAAGDAWSLARVELVVALGDLSDPIGLILLSASSRGRTLDSAETEFVRTISDHASLALCNADLASGLVANERHATAGRVAVALAHDLGKNLDWMRRLTSRLPERLNDRIIASRDLALLRQLVQEVRDTIQGFVQDATRGSADPRGAVAVDRLIQEAAEISTRRHKDSRVTYSVAPAARKRRTSENLMHVLVNLLDNAIEADSNEFVHIFCTSSEGRIRITVTDRGPGLPHSPDGSSYQRAFAGTKADGMGAGLAISRDIVSSLSGTLELVPSPLGGTRATINVPEWVAEPSLD